MKKFNYLFTLLGICLILTFSCQKEDIIETSTINELQIDINKKAVIGGNTIDIKHAPYQVAIFINGEFNGGGVIINNEWILTAAHVIHAYNQYYQQYFRYPNNAITVRLGNSNRNLGTVYTISESHVHPGFSLIPSYPQPNDIALIRLSSLISFNENQQPITYSSTTNHLNVGDQVTVSGWGGTVCDYTNPNSSISLKSALLSVNNLNDPLNIGINSYSQSAFKGDSGGPLVRNVAGIGKILVGLVSTGKCEYGEQNYTRISEHADWIRDVSRVYSIVGSDEVCNSATYSIANLPNGANVNWSLNSPGTANLITSNNLATVTTSNGGPVVLNASVNLPTGTFTTSKYIYARKTLDYTSASDYGFITSGGLNRYFSNIDYGNGDMSIVISNEVQPGTFESDLIQIGNPNVTSMTLSVLNSNSNASIVALGNNQFRIRLRGNTTVANIRATYSNPCGTTVTHDVYVRAPQGWILIPPL